LKNEETIHSVLIEEIVDGFSVGYTDNYIYTYIPEKLEVGKIVNVKLKEEYLNGMIGEKE